MKPAAFEYHAPKTLQGLLDLMRAHGDEGRILAGGQSLVPVMNFRLARPAHLFDINEIRELDYLKSEGGTLRIGALTRHAAFHKPVAPGPPASSCARRRASCAARWRAAASARSASPRARRCSPPPISPG